MQLIGLLGAAGSGKSTVARFLREDHGYTELAFADPLKAAAQAIFGFSADQLHGLAKEQMDPYWKMTPRKALQRLGTEAIRHTFGPDTWVLALDRRRQKMGPRIVISDVRFENEAGAVRQWGGVLWRVTRPVQAIQTDEERRHASETEARTIEVDHEFLNTAGLPDLRRAVSQELHLLGG